MHVALVHNVTAGDREHETEDLVSLLRRAGHEVSEFGKTKRDVARAIALYPDALAVAGGDGTVSKAAVALRGSTVPLVILPIGTANNIAQSVGVSAPVGEIVRGLATARQARLDIGRASGPWGDRKFVEAMNIRQIGPRVRLAPEADHADGLLDLVLVSPDARDALVEYVSSPEMLLERVPAISRRVRSVEISWPPHDGHVDDKPWPRERDEVNDEQPQVEISVKGHVALLVPTGPLND